MLMLHSEEEWWISAATQLDELPVHPASGGAAAKLWPRAKPMVGGEGRCLRSLKKIEGIFGLLINNLLFIYQVPPQVSQVLVEFVLVMCLSNYFKQRTLF